jgi:aminopeptidase N
MHKSLLFFCLFFTTLLKAQTINVLHYKYALDLNDKNDTIYGLAEIRVLMTAPGPVAFDLVERNKDGKGMLVTKVDVGDTSANTRPFQQEGAKVIIPIIKGGKGDTLLVRIRYKGIPADGLIVSKNKFGDRTFFADNWPDRARHWIPCVDRPDDKASFEFLVTAPVHYRVVSNGQKVEEKDLGNGKRYTHWKEDIALPTKVMVIGVARFAVKTFTDSPEKLPVSAWVYPQDSTKGFYDYALTPEIVRFFSDYIAPFPYQKLANVQSTTIFGGMENASCIFYAENSVTGDRSSEDLMAHEIAHQWFGDMASEKSFAHLWLSEGFASYLTDLYWEHKYGKEALQMRLQKERKEVIDFARSSKNPVVDSTTNLMSLLNANSYQKGAWVLHMLRMEVGDTVFQKIIQTYYNQYKGGNAETKDFAAVAEKVFGKNLKSFFDQWLYRSGVPRLKFKTINTKEGTRFTIEQVQKDLYQFSLSVNVETATSKEMTTTFPMAERVKTVMLPKGQIIKLVVDPNSTLLYEEVK